MVYKGYQKSQKKGGVVTHRLKLRGICVLQLSLFRMMTAVRDKHRRSHCGNMKLLV